jgi:hypothetical protein
VTFRQVAAFCIDLACAAILAETFYRMRNNLFCEPCRLEGKRIVAEKIYHMALVKPPVGDVPVCMACAASLRKLNGEIVDVAEA